MSYYGLYEGVLYEVNVLYTVRFYYIGQNQKFYKFLLLYKPSRKKLFLHFKY